MPLCSVITCALELCSVATLLLLHLPGARAIYHLHPWKEAWEENGSLAGKRLSPGSILALHQVWLAATFTLAPGATWEQATRHVEEGKERPTLEWVLPAAVLGASKHTHTPLLTSLFRIGHKSRKRKASGRNSCIQLVNQATSRLLWFL